MKPGNILAVSVIGLFLVLGLVRLYPYDNSLPWLLKSELNDDWVWYARIALDIKNGEAPAIPVSYRWPLPSGFLYYYFIALCFKVFGDNTVPIYLIQHITIGASCAIMYWTFKDRMRPLTGILFLGGLVFFNLFDVYKNYAARLLSENITFFLMPIFFFCFIKGFMKGNLKLQLLSAFILGLAILTRFNILFYGVSLIILVTPVYLKRRLKGIISLLLFSAVMGGSVLSLPISNYLRYGRWNLFPNVATDPMWAVRLVHPVPKDLELAASKKKTINIYTGYMRQRPKLFFSHYLKKIIFAFGFNSILDRRYRLRPHWMVMWIGYFTYIFLCLKEHRPIQLWEKAVHLYIACYYITIFAFTTIHNYGFRFLIPAMNFVLLFSFLAVDGLSER